MNKKIFNKYSLVLMLLFSVGLYSCSSSKEARGIKSNINGNWILQTVTADGITGIVKTKVFNEAEFGCFKM